MWISLQVKYESVMNLCRGGRQSLFSRIRGGRVGGEVGLAGNLGPGSEEASLAGIQGRETTAVCYPPLLWWAAGNMHAPSRAQGT